MASFIIDVTGPYSLAASRSFLEGFTPVSGGAASVDDGLALALAFRLDGTFAPTGVLLRQEGARVHGEVTVGDVATVQKQAARMLGLDVDARAWAKLGAADAALQDVMKANPGFRPVAFPSPWEAGVWGLLSHRINMKQAAAIKRKVAVEHGDIVIVGAAQLPVFPSPQQVLAMPTRPSSIPEEKWLRLASLAQAAQAGVLDADRLRALPSADALAELTKLRGVGPWTAAHIHIRGAATVDVIALEEPRVRLAVQHAYQMKSEPDDEQMRTISDRWRPYRTWAMVLLAMHLNRTGQWSAPSSSVRGRARKK